ncbi:MAG TPA: nitrate/nitrite transporter NrtS [Gammaproteobacteria bacterium]|nr:nitrate/nitrite transporter NrtS [Gammaproteobacteria bacterium]
MGCKSALDVICEPKHLRWNLLITLVIGTWLVLFNLGDILLQGDFSLKIWIKLILNYITPFVVANLGLLGRAK